MRATLRGQIGAAFRPSESTDRDWSSSADYRLVSSVGRAFAAVSRTGLHALVIPLATAPATVTRCAAGCLLRPATDVEFEFAGKRWRQAAVSLECSDPSMHETFEALALDMAARISAFEVDPVWNDIAEIFDEWQALLANRRRLSPEAELGLWAEAWLMLQAEQPTKLAEGWVGPEKEQTDFVVAGVGVEAKASRTRLKHFVSQAQVERPVGEYDSYFLSIWIGVDPERGVSLPTLIDRVLARADDDAALLKGLLRAGYSTLDRELYSRPYVVVELPLWFSSDSVPRVRSADAGVSQLRYLAELDPDRRLATARTTTLWKHFLGRSVESLADLSR